MAKKTTVAPEVTPTSAEQSISAATEFLANGGSLRITINETNLTDTEGIRNVCNFSVQFKFNGKTMMSHNGGVLKVFKSNGSKLADMNIVQKRYNILNVQQGGWGRYINAVLIEGLYTNKIHSIEYKGVEMDIIGEPSFRTTEYNEQRQKPTNNALAGALAFAKAAGVVVESTDKVEEKTKAESVFS